MRISPLDIRKQAFKRTMRGADPEEVRIFLELVASEYEKVLQENAMMAERIRHQDERLAEYRDLEKSMRNSLVTAERIASESRESSEREASRVVQDAHLRAERILEDARERLQGLIREIETLRGKKEVYARRFWTLLEGQISVLQEHMSDPGEVDSLRQSVARLMEESRPDPHGAAPAAAEQETERWDLDEPSGGGGEDPAGSGSAERPEVDLERAGTGVVEEPEAFGVRAEPGFAPLPSGPASPPTQPGTRPAPRGLARILHGRQPNLPLAEEPRPSPRGNGREEEPEGMFPIQQRREGYFEIHARDEQEEGTTEER